MKKLFYVYDSVEEINIGYFEAQSLDVLLRNNAKAFAQLCPHYVDDWKFYCLGSSPKPTNNGFNLDLFEFLETDTLKPIDITSSSEVELASTPMTPEEVEKLKSQK